jgi:hypothetical protein
MKKANASLTYHLNNLISMVFARRRNNFALFLQFVILVTSEQNTMSGI